MKCDHDGCTEEAVGYAGGEVEGESEFNSPMLCRLHIAAWIRAMADDVDGRDEAVKP